MKSVILIVSLLLALYGQVLAQTATLSGILGDKALLIVNGRPPKIVAQGETYFGVKVISTLSDKAVVELNGVKQTLRVGDSPVSVGSRAPGVSGNRVVLSSRSGGHYLTSGQINGHAVQFMLDSGATFVSLGASDAARIGLDYRSGQVVQSQTANGITYAWRSSLAKVQVGDVTLYDVDALVLPTTMPTVLLGNSFLSRFQMTQANGQMILERLY